MSDNIKLAADVESTDPTVPLGFEAWLNDTKFYDTDWVQHTVNLSHEFSDEEGTHVLKFVLKNKSSDHTKIDEHGNIIKDALVNIKNIKIDNIDIGEIVGSLSTYTHDFNGSGTEVQEPFCDAMGCNGTVSLEFTTPFYLWLLDNM